MIVIITHCMSIPSNSNTDNTYLIWSYQKKKKAFLLDVIFPPELSTESPSTTVCSVKSTQNPGQEQVVPFICTSPKGHPCFYLFQTELLLQGITLTSAGETPQQTQTMLPAILYVLKIAKTVGQKYRPLK